MKKKTASRYLSLALLCVLILGMLLLSGCATSSKPVTNDDGTYQTVDTSKLSTDVSMGLFDYVKLPFAYLMGWLYSLTGNYGIALILFATLVKLVLLPASAKSKKSMMKMSRLTPKVKAIEAKYPDDKTKQQAEINKLYQEEGTGGCMGCLWSFLPLLILIPLYQIIREPITWLMFHGKASSATLAEVQNVFINARNAAYLANPDSALAGLNTAGFYWQMEALPFISEVKTELAAISPAIFSMNTRFLGIELATVPHLMFWNYFALGVWNAVGQFLLPVISGGVNWLSMWFSQRQNDTVIVNENGEQDKSMASQNQTTKTMTMLMPLMSIYIGFVAPAGLSIYWITQAVLSTVQDSFLTKYYKKVYDAEDKVKQERAAAEAAKEAERERIRAEKRAENPEGITANTSKKKLQQRERNEQAAKDAAYQAQQAAEREKELEVQAKPADDGSRPFRRGRNFDPNRYKNDKE